MEEPGGAVPARPESVWDYPRPPRVESVTQEIEIEFNGELIAQSRAARRVLETSHPPVYYIPRADIKSEFLQPARGTTWCEWKGRAAYFDIVVAGKIARRAAWSYADPAPGFEAIRDHLAFYAHKMDACYVGDERVRSQEGDFYGGWITSNIVGPFKGGPGTAGW